MNRMLRLLWKEWVEIRLLLLGLLAAPVFSMLVLKDQCGFLTKSWGDYMPIPAQSCWIALVVISVWAASRFPEEMRRGWFSVFWIPVRVRDVLAVKFLPGVVAIALAAPWTGLMFWLIAPFRFGEPPEPRLLVLPTIALFAPFLMAYCVAFNVSLCGSTAIGALAGLVFSMCLLVYPQSPLREFWEAFVVCLFPQGYFMGIPPQDRLMSQYCADLSLPLAFSVLQALGAMIICPGVRKQSARGRVLSAVGVSALMLSPFVILYLCFVPRSSLEPPPAVNILPSPDGQRVAMTTGCGGWGNKHGVAVLNLSDEKTREVLAGQSADLIAWSRDSQTLYVQTCSNKPPGSNILRVDEHGKISHVAVLPPEKDAGWSTERERGRVTPNGRYIVVLEKPRYGMGIDLWSIDLETDTRHVLVANASYLRPDWDLLSNDSVILPSHKEIALDGSGVIREWLFQ